jgi:hypothetical protein
MDKQFAWKTPRSFNILNNDDVYQDDLTYEPIWEAYLHTPTGGNGIPEEGLANAELRRLTARMLFRRCFIASGKGIIGIGPYDAQIGDYIYICAGSEAALLLRPCSDGKWSLVGEFYAHGLMNGLEAGPFPAYSQRRLVELEIV